MVGLLEHDLLQALPLYALIGALLNRLPLAGLMHAAGERLVARSPASAQLCALGVGALLAPMNGSVGASLHMLARRVAGAGPARVARPKRERRSASPALLASIRLRWCCSTRGRDDAPPAVRHDTPRVRIVTTRDVRAAAPGLAGPRRSARHGGMARRHRARAAPRR